MPHRFSPSLPQSCLRRCAEEGQSMLHTDKVIVVEGRYDKIRLSSVVDALIITTDGFHIFNDREKQALLKKLARERGLIILTDSDAAGFKIRTLIKNIVPSETVTHVFIPDIFGKERRKEAPSKEGKLGVEGIDNRLLEAALIKSGAFVPSCEEKTERKKITSVELFEAGLTGKPDSAEKRRSFLKKCALPARLTGNTLLGALNAIMTYEDFCKAAGLTEENNA